ncbi:hypothetical protein OEZ86_013705 [Tetradesmus obliquus]|uniref:Uncharacterized protein n=2 Tax=Tetradesmus obliquus TaxID=3088 RepID=A0A383VUY0_TETOB|nr:hypothetical protein OEZ85_005915 [Tetradesmus obliquus]WIA40338.1 hypothetical protein OEZ86_013705 [Tetradesmus obliquus]|eukprot:jgi/Sobl393_1/16042/SZX68673.1
MPFKRYVEIGRVALVNFGEDYGKLVVITDVVDQNRALVDAPTETRRIMPFKRMTLTDLTVEIPRLASKKVLTAAFTSADVAGKFAASAWGKKLAARQSKANQNDFERYQAAVAKAKRNRAVRKAYNQLAKSA